MDDDHTEAQSTNGSADEPVSQCACPGDDPGQPDDEPPAAEPPAPASFRRALWGLAESASAWPGPEQLVELAASVLGLEASPSLFTLAHAANRLDDDVRPGDVLVRSLPAQGIRYASVVVSEPGLRGDLVLRGVPVEAGGRGLYVEVADVPIEGGALRSVGRRLTDAWGRVPRGQSVLRVAGRPLPDFYGEDDAAACPWWMPVDTSTDYFQFAQPKTSGTVTLLKNGRSSGGTGPNDDRCEPFNEMQDAVEATKSGDSVLLASWMFDPDTELTKATTVSKAKTWGDLIAAKAKAGVVFRILLNEFPALMKWSTNFKALDALVAGLTSSHWDNVKYVLTRHPAHITLTAWWAKRLSKFSGVPLAAGDHHVAVYHQKFMVVRYVDKMTTFCGGVDIIPGMTPKKWSTTKWHGWHDLQVRLEGPITRDLEKEFVERWNRELGSTRRTPAKGWSTLDPLKVTPWTKPKATSPIPEIDMQMLRTISESKGDTLSQFAKTRRDDVRQAYLHGIACAESFLYVENQYYRTLEFADWIVTRGKEKPELIVIIVVVHPDLAAADDGKNAFTDHGIALQFETFDKIVTGLGAKRVRFYEMHDRYVHSKVIFADDKWWCIGSANVNGRGFGLDNELNVQMRESKPNQLLELRKQLWAHNLGVSEATVGGWAVSDFIAKWDAVAASNAKVSRDAMQGEGVKAFDYTKFQGAKLALVPDLLAHVGLPGGRVVGDRGDRVA